MNPNVIPPDAAIQAAERELAIGNLTAADLWCQEARSVDPTNSAAGAFLGRLSSRLALVDEGWTWRQDGASPGQKRYLVIKAWGEGFWSDTFHVLGCLLLADITGRIPIVHWGSNSRFRGQADEAFHQFWRPVSSATLADAAAAAEGGVFPPKWSKDNLADEDNGRWSGPYARLGPIEFLNRPEPVVVCDFFISPALVAPWLPTRHSLHGQSFGGIFSSLATRYLEPVPALRARIAEFWNRNLAGRDVLAVHLRGADKGLEQGNVDEVNATILRLMEAEPDSRAFLVLTDDVRLLAEARQRFGDRVIVTEAQRGEKSVGLHYSDDTDRVALAQEVLVDAYLAMGCGGFLGNGTSNVSCAAALLRVWRQGENRLVGPPQVCVRDHGMYATADTGIRGDFALVKGPAPGNAGAA